MSTLNQQTLADLGANERPSLLERGNYMPRESRFRRFLDNKLEDGERMWNSIQNGPYLRPMIPNPDDTTKQILEPLSKMTTELGMMKEIKLFSVFHELNQLRERQMFSVITAIKKGHYARDYHKPRVRDAKYVREQMLLGVKDEAGSNLNNEENDFMLDTSMEKKQMKSVTAVVLGVYDGSNSN
ncbi:hypothetical protein Tco_0895870 [Tanacetum coccineum]|uniref:Uncharacterized protein n=1 Tax=Tanacetum coccineum TaxID=301880 RepID=A0ABQ5CJ13_9ASTR